MAGIYFHIPFCKKRCKYCDFFSSSSNESVDRYIDALIGELILRNEYLGDREIGTLYFGGGTPSQLEEIHWQKLFTFIENNINLKPNSEITTEVNPDDITTEYLKMLSSFPINRISMGVQSFNDKHLETLGRRHNSRQAIEAIENIRKAGFGNLSIDLMYGLPSQNLCQWEHDLDLTLSLKPEHISAYHLTYEENTVLYNSLKEGKVEPICEDDSIRFFETLIEKLTNAGYKHYEISNFALPGKESCHNSNYWKDIPYIGCGASAHSFDDLSRQWNISNIAAYIKGIESGEPNMEIENLSLHERYNDTIITRLRTADGLSLQLLMDKFGKKLYDHCLKMSKPHIEKNNLIIDKVDNILRLTRGGIFISDSIFRDLIYI